MSEHDLWSWITTAGTALSGLGSTLSGLHTLHGLGGQVVPHLTAAGQSAAAAAPSLAGGFASGAVALSSGWLSAAHLLGPGAGLSMTTLGLCAGCVYASTGFVYFLWSLTSVSAEQPPAHAPAPGSTDAVTFPEPDWLSTRVLNWAVVGPVGAGKSTLINALRGLYPQDRDAAPVGVGHTTRQPRPYSFVGDVAALTHNMARLWDLPGAGTKDWPMESYVRDAGLRHFDGVVLVTAGVFTEAESWLAFQLRDFKVPYYIARNKVDMDVVNNQQDNNAEVHDTLSEIRGELAENGCCPSRTFLISAKQPDRVEFDFGLLLRTMAADVASQRGQLPEFQRGPGQHAPRHPLRPPFGALIDTPARPATAQRPGEWQRLPAQGPSPGLAALADGGAACQSPGGCGCSSVSTRTADSSGSPASLREAPAVPRPGRDAPGWQARGALAASLARQ